MTFIISTASENAAADAVTALINAGGAGTIDIRTGSQPAGPGTTATGTLLVTLTLSSTSFAAASSGVAALNTVTSGTAVATGTAAWFRIKSGAGTAIMDGTVGTSGADINLSSTSIISGGTVGITSGSYTQPAS